MYNIVDSTMEGFAEKLKRENEFLDQFEQRKVDGVLSHEDRVARAIAMRMHLKGETEKKEKLDDFCARFDIKPIKNLHLLQDHTPEKKLEMKGKKTVVEEAKIVSNGEVELKILGNKVTIDNETSHVSCEGVNLRLDKDDSSIYDEEKYFRQAYISEKIFYSYADIASTNTEFEGWKYAVENLPKFREAVPDRYYNVFDTPGVLDRDMIATSLRANAVKRILMELKKQSSNKKGIKVLVLDRGSESHTVFGNLRHELPGFNFFQNWDDVQSPDIVFFEPFGRCISAESNVKDLSDYEDSNRDRLQVYLNRYNVPEEPPRYVMNYEMLDPPYRKYFNEYDVLEEDQVWYPIAPHRYRSFKVVGMYHKNEYALSYDSDFPEESIYKFEEWGKAVLGYSVLRNMLISTKYKKAHERFLLRIIKMDDLSSSLSFKLAKVPVRNYVRVSKNRRVVRDFPKLLAKIQWMDDYGSYSYERMMEKGLSSSDLEFLVAKGILAVCNVGNYVSYSRRLQDDKNICFTPKTQVMVGNVSLSSPGAIYDKMVVVQNSNVTETVMNLYNALGPNKLTLGTSILDTGKGSQGVSHVSSPDGWRVQRKQKKRNNKGRKGGGKQQNKTRNFSKSKNPGKKLKGTSRYVRKN